MQNLNNLVNVVDDKPITTSIRVSEVFNKEHSKVLRAIRSLNCSEKFTEANFGLSEYADETGRTLPMFTITRDGFTFLAMGFTGKKAAQFKEAYINAFNQMELALRSQVSANTEIVSQNNSRYVDNHKPNKTLLTPDKNGFYSIILYFSKLRYVFEDEEILFLLDDINYFLEVTRLNGIDKERTKDNYTIHNILCDYNIIPRLKIINDNHYLFLRLPQLIEFCDRYKTKRSSMLQEALEYKLVKYVSKHFKNEIEDRKLLMITA